MIEIDKLSSDNYIKCGINLEEVAHRDLQKIPQNVSSSQAKTKRQELKAMVLDKAILEKWQVK